MTKVVVTGIGLVTPLGSNSQKSWGNLISGKSGITQIPEQMFDASDLRCKIAGIVPDFDVTKYMPEGRAETMDPFTHYAIAASDEAMEDAGLKIETEEQSLYSGTLIGSGIGGLQTIEREANKLKEKGPRRVSPYFIPASLINLASGQVSIRHNLKGPNISTVTACSSGAHAIGDATEIIKRGDAKVMIAGGAEAAICKLGIAGFAALRALSTKYNDTPQEASRPWDTGRDGFVMGEGAAVLVLEEYEHAKKRGAKIYAEIAGYGISGDAGHITAPSGEGAYRAMQMALKHANVNTTDVDYINAHGTSTPVGDKTEFASVQRLFNDNNKLLMSSTKSSIGHLLGAAGSVELAFSILAMKHGIVPPTLNLNNIDEECKGIDLVPLHAKEHKVNIALSNSFGFGGTNASIVIKNAS